MTRYHALTLAAALFALASASPAALAQAQASGHPAALNAARPMTMQKAAKPGQKGQPTAKVTKSAPQSLRWLDAESP
jgi:hypothetical protein